MTNKSLYGRFRAVGNLLNPSSNLLEELYSIFTPVVVVMLVDIMFRKEGETSSSYYFYQYGISASTYYRAFKSLEKQGYLDITEEEILIGKTNGGN